MCSPDTQAVQDWRPAVQALAGGLPGQRAVDRVLRWISIESCGNPCSIDGSKKWQTAAGWIQDAGVMQIYFDTQNTVIDGATSASLRINCVGTTQQQTRTLTDAERQSLLAPQIAWLASAISDAQSQLDAVGAAWTERDQWRWYKAVTHGLPAYAKCMMWTVVNRLGRAPNDWDEFKSTAQTITADEVATGAADPSNNGCTWTAANFGATSLFAEVWNNAEEMDLPDEMSFFQLITSDAGPLSMSGGDMSGKEIILAGIFAIGAFFAAQRASRYLFGKVAV
jgi:hypothetical protein